MSWLRGRRVHGFSQPTASNNVLVAMGRWRGGLWPKTCVDARGRVPSKLLSGFLLYPKLII